LEAVTTDEFWWLNNGVTILARECPISGNTLTITNPEVVNGLQTSYEICQFFRDCPANLVTDTRSLVLRVIIPPNEHVSSKIIKATNFQTEVKGMSLHATEQIHFDIEDKLGLVGLWYDRKKGKYKRLRKPISDIISVVDLARCVIAILLMRPDDARGRPQSLLADDRTYLEIFSRSYDCAVYVFCIRLDRRIAAFLESGQKYTTEEQRDIRYYLDLWAACALVNSAQPSASTLPAAIPKLDTISDDEIARYAAKIRRSYRRMGGEQIAKSQRFSAAIKRRLRHDFPVTVTP
jgi:hypothetical protein